MKITAFTAHSVEHDGELYTRYGPDNWTVRMGESDESVYRCEELEAEFQRCHTEKPSPFDKLDDIIRVMKPRYYGHPSMDGRYPCWFVWLPKHGSCERKSLRDAVIEFHESTDTP